MVVLTPLTAVSIFDSTSTVFAYGLSSVVTFSSAYLFALASAVATSPSISLLIAVFAAPTCSSVYAFALSSAPVTSAFVAAFAISPTAMVTFPVKA